MSDIFQKFFHWHLQRLLWEFFHRFVKRLLLEFSKDSTRDSTVSSKNASFCFIQKLLRGFLQGHLSRNLCWKVPPRNYFLILPRISIVVSKILPTHSANIFQGPLRELRLEFIQRYTRNFFYKGICPSIPSGISPEVFFLEFLKYLLAHIGRKYLFRYFQQIPYRKFSTESYQKFCSIFS